jgi:hypothetical protein
MFEQNLTLFNNKHIMFDRKDPIVAEVLRKFEKDLAPNLGWIRVDRRGKVIGFEIPSTTCLCGRKLSLPKEANPNQKTIQCACGKRWRKTVRQ